MEEVLPDGTIVTKLVTTTRVVDKLTERSVVDEPVQSVSEEPVREAGTDGGQLSHIVYSRTGR